MGKVVAKLAMQPEAIKIRLEGEMTVTKSITITDRDGDTCNTSAPAPKMQDL